MEIRITKLENQQAKHGGAIASASAIASSAGYTSGTFEVTDGPLIVSEEANTYGVEIVDYLAKWEQSLLTGNATAGNNYVDVADGSIFEATDTVAVHDTNGYNNWEGKTIQSISTNRLYFTENLSNSYATAHNAAVSHWIPSQFPESTDSSFGALVHKDETTENYIKDFLVMIGSDPIRVIDQGYIIKKDITAGGFLGTNQGAVFYGYGLNHSQDPPKDVLMDYADGYTTKHIFGLDGSGNQVLANMRFSTAYVDNYKQSSGALHPLICSEKGQTTTDANGDKTVTFTQSYSAAPYVLAQAIDASGRGIVIDVVSKNTTQVVFKAHSTQAHKHKIGVAAVTSSYTPTISSESSHTHNFSGLAAVSASASSTTTVANSSHYHDVVGETGVTSDPTYATHTHYYSTTSPSVSAPYGTVAVASSSHEHATGSCAGTTGVGSSHNHTLTDWASYARDIWLRDADGNEYDIGVVFNTASKTETDLYSESVLASANEVAVTFEYFVFPAS